MMHWGLMINTIMVQLYLKSGNWLIFSLYGSCVLGFACFHVSVLYFFSSEYVVGELHVSWRLVALAYHAL